jgi:hypothetical protein
MSHDTKRFILWSRVDGPNPPRDERGNFLTSGSIGWVGVENVYLLTYAKYPDGRRPEHLELGESIPNVVFSLSAERGEYDVYRVE